MFTTIPLDQYTYTILSHPDPELVGKTLVVSLPRDPITLQAERGFFNRSVPERLLHVDERVFRHTLGEPATYPTRSDRLQFPARLEAGPVSVGQGSGETEVTLEVGEEFSEGSTLELGFELELECTGSVGEGLTQNYVSGYSVGASLSSSLRVTSGQSTTYTGVVGAIDAANFAANRYSFGLFTYVHRDPLSGREFEVLNYWIE